ncbi:DUF58 domain-containing protein [Candidatus Haliotispira prima]|uniref:DUF58 domain-containing protein n=1 Tax=Candidatus Haliotispira prima TaxID=3034016 RepID=A0ABY8MJ36_9SPIO|nr:DUF58 domain-containing protein [Candidatus Haliotispira prima]
MIETSEIHKYIWHLNLTVNRLVEEMFAGNYRAIFKGFGLEFAEIREYMDGDDTRMIDWNVFARTGQLHSKTFQEERELAMVIIADCSASMLEANMSNRKFDLQLFLFALFGAAAAMHNDRVGSIFYHQDVAEFFPPRKGRKYVMQQLTSLTAQLGRAYDNRGSNLGQALGLAAQRMRKRGICIILSDFLSLDYEKELAILAHRHDVIAIRLGMEFHNRFPSVGLSRLSDYESQESHFFWGHSADLKNRYKDYWQRQEEQWQRICHRCGVDSYSIFTNENMVQKIYEYLWMRRKNGRNHHHVRNVRRF